MGISRVCVKASRAFGPRRFHTNTVYIVFCSGGGGGGGRGAAPSTPPPPLDLGPSDRKWFLMKMVSDEIGF